MVRYFILAAIVLLSGCEDTPTEVIDYKPDVSLYAYLINEKPLEKIFIERVSPLGGIYHPQGIADCDVKVFSTTGVDTFRFKQSNDPDSSHIYVTDGQILSPVGKRRYRVEVYTPLGEYVWAETLIPAKFDSIFVVDTLFIDPPINSDYWIDTLQRTDPAIVIGWSTVDSAGGYFGIVINETPLSELEPLDPDWDPDDPDQEIDTLDVSQNGWTFMRDDQRVTTIPWIAFEWVGVHQIQLTATSREYYNYIFSIIRGGPGLGDRPQFNVNGGIGMVAGKTLFSCYVYVKKSD